MYTVVTGAAGFIGSNLVRALNARGDRQIIAVDNLARADKIRNLADCDIADFLDKDEFLARLHDGDFAYDIAAVLHQGACSDTMETDGRYVMRNNYRYSVSLVDYCQEQEIPFLYASSASVYGAGGEFREERACEAPLNVYGYSKFLFDQYVRGLEHDRTAQIAGFRYFNVYGMREQHKGRGSSVAWHFFNQFRNEGKVRLFEGSGGYANGEQRRDFVHVDDIVRANLYFLDHPDVSGIFNLGTGRAQSFNDVATAVLNAASGEAPRTAAQWAAAGRIEYIAFPPALVGKYQSFTQADLTRLRIAGYAAPFATVEEGVTRYVKALAAGTLAPAGSSA
jgi:ADP-L-glycero-D-manno-heptose 6-epimerase